MAQLTKTNDPETRGGKITGGSDSCVLVLGVLEDENPKVHGRSKHIPLLPSISHSDGLPLHLLSLN